MVVGAWVSHRFRPSLNACAHSTWPNWIRRFRHEPTRAARLDVAPSFRSRRPNRAWRPSERKTVDAFVGGSPMAFARAARWSPSNWSGAWRDITCPGMSLGILQHRPRQHLDRGAPQTRRPGQHPNPRRSPPRAPSTLLGPGSVPELAMRLRPSRRPRGLDRRARRESERCDGIEPAVPSMEPSHHRPAAIVDGVTFHAYSSKPAPTATGCMHQRTRRRGPEGPRSEAAELGAPRPRGAPRTGRGSDRPPSR